MSEHRARAMPETTSVLSHSDGDIQGLSEEPQFGSWQRIGLSERVQSGEPT